MIRISRTLSIAALTAIAVVAFAASTSAESTEVHVEREVSPAHEPCDPCYVHAYGEEEAEFESALNHAAVIGQCLTEVEGEIGEDGEGHITITELTDGPSANCNVSPCPGAEGEWPTHIREIGGQLRGAARFCLALGTSTVHCDLEVDLEDVGTHDWMVRADNEVCTNGPPVAFTGEWHLEHEIHDNLEIEHVR